MSMMRETFKKVLSWSTQTDCFVLRLRIKVDLRSREFSVVRVIVLSLIVGVNEQV